MTNISDVTVIIVNYKTQKITQECVVSLVRLFPNVSILLVDNHSQDKSSKYCKRVSKKVPTMSLLEMDKNVGHGPAMNRAIHTISTRFFFTLDSDCRILKRGFFRPMLNEFDNPWMYAVGWLRWVNTSGVAARPGLVNDNNKHKFIPYIHPHAALFDREKYLALHPFEPHGSPCLSNMVWARKKGFAVRDFPIQEYIKHLGAGTRRMWGGAWDIADRKPITKWKKNDNYPL